MTLMLCIPLANCETNKIISIEERSGIFCELSSQLSEMINNDEWMINANLIFMSRFVFVGAKELILNLLGITIKVDNIYISCNNDGLNESLHSNVTMKGIARIAKTNEWFFLYIFYLFFYLVKDAEVNALHFLAVFSVLRSCNINQTWQVS